MKIFLLLNELHLLGCKTEPIEKKKDIEETVNNGDSINNDYPISNAVPVEYIHRIVGEQTHDWTGMAIAGNADVDGDERADILIGALQNDEAGPGAGKAYLLTSSNITETNQSIADVKSFLGESAGNCAGASVAFVDDLDGDYLSEVLIGAPCHNRVYLFLASSLQTDHALEEADYIFMGQEAGDYLGWSIAGVGDVNDDGRGDFLIGADGADDQGISSGNAFLVQHTIFNNSEPINIGDVSTELWGTSEMENVGNAVSGAGDIDGDGLDDILIGAKGSNEGGEKAGKVYLLSGSEILSFGAQFLGDFTSQFIGEDFDEAGDSVSGAGDIDGDGLGDLLIGAPGSSYEHSLLGKVYIVFGSSISPQQSLATASVIVEGLFVRDHTGHSVASAGDIDGDNLADVLIGSPSLYSHDHSGAAYIFTGAVINAGGNFSVQDANFILEGENHGDTMGFFVTNGGDINGDNNIDLLVGAPGYDGEVKNQGGIYVFSPSLQ